MDVTHIKIPLLIKGFHNPCYSTVRLGVYVTLYKSTMMKTISTKLRLI